MTTPAEISGPEQRAIDNAQVDLEMDEYLRRTVRPAALLGELHDLYDNGRPVSPGTGLGSLDRHYRPAPGQFTVVTGYPGSGKSELVDQIALNLAKLHDWRICYYSPENFPHSTHVVKLAEKLLGKPFDRGPSERMTPEELDDAVRWLDTRFGFIRQTQTQPNSVEAVLLEAWFWCERHPGKSVGIVLDPWNEFEHLRARHQSETEYTSEVLSFVRRFARTKNCHIWLIAHPAKLQRDRDGKRPVPTPGDISGSAHFWNKADACLTVHRPDMESSTVEIHVQKVRSKWCGHPGLVEVRYERIAGQYREIEG